MRVVYYRENFKFTVLMNESNKCVMMVRSQNGNDMELLKKLWGVDKIEGFGVYTVLYLLLRIIVIKVVGVVIK